MKWKKRVRRATVYQLSRLGEKLALTLSLEKGLALGAFLARLVFYLLKKERRKALRSLQLAYREEGKTSRELEKIALACYQNLGKCCFELVNLPYMSDDGLRALVSVKGQENLQAALARGKGVLCVTAHLGNWEMLAAFTSRCLGHRVNVIARRINNEGLNESMIDLRSRLGVNTILRDRGFAAQRLILSALARNEIIGILMDQDTKVNGVFVDFFGRPAYTPTGPAALALATGAAIVPTFIVRRPDDTHQITFFPVFELQPAADKEERLRKNTAALTAIIEERVRHTPEQWVWMHQRWRRRPNKQ